MKVEIDIEAGLLQTLSVRCITEKVSFDDLVNAWLRRASRQEKTVLPTVENHRSKVLPMRPTGA